jgi:hypothetical protein
MARVFANHFPILLSPKAWQPKHGMRTTGTTTLQTMGQKVPHGRIGATCNEMAKRLQGPYGIRAKNQISNFRSNRTWVENRENIKYVICMNNREKSTESSELIFRFFVFHFQVEIMILKVLNSK